MRFITEPIEMEKPIIYGKKFIAALVTSCNKKTAMILLSPRFISAYL